MKAEVSLLRRQRRLRPRAGTRFLRNGHVLFRRGQKLLGLDYIVFHRLDPVQGAARPHGLQNGWHVYNGHYKLACGWSEPPHIAGG